MKRRISLLCMLSIFTCLLMAQQPSSYISTMLSLIEELDTVGAKNDDFVSLGAKFERIGNVEKEEWLPYYYAAYCYAMKALNTSKETEKYADTADKLLDLALERGGDRSEILCIKSYVATSRFILDPQQRWMTDGKASSDFINEAVKENSENPRAYLLLGQSVLYTPKAYGGGFEIAEKILNNALEKFKVFKPESELSPNWGEDYTRHLLTKKGNI